MTKKSALGMGIGALLNDDAKKSALAQKITLDMEIEKKLSRELNQELEDFKQTDEKDLLEKDQESLDTTNNKNEENTLVMLSLESVSRNKSQPRKIFKEEELRELSVSIKENGVLQPIIVSKVENGYQIIAGERRFRAAKLAGLNQIPAIVKRTTDREKLVFGLLENIQRSNLNPIEEAMALYELMNDFNMTQEQLSNKLGKDRSTIANYLRLLKLPRAVVDLIQRELINFGQAKILAGLKEMSLVNELATECVKNQLSVRALEALIKKKSRPAEENSTKESKVFEQFMGPKDDLQRHTGFHVDIKAKTDESGTLTIKFNSKNEFNKIFDHLMR